MLSDGSSAGSETPRLASRLLAPGDGELADGAARLKYPFMRCPQTDANGTKTAMDLFRYSFDVPRMIAAVRGIILRHGIDMVYVNGPRALPAVAGLSRLPVIFHAHNDSAAVISETSPGVPSGARKET